MMSSLFTRLMSISHSPQLKSCLLFASAFLRPEKILFSPSRERYSVSRKKACSISISDIKIVVQVWQMKTYAHSEGHVFFLQHGDGCNQGGMQLNILMLSKIMVIILTFFQIYMLSESREYK